MSTNDGANSTLPHGHGYYEAEERGELKRTDNAFGWQMNSLDEFSLAFIDEINKRTGTPKIADLGMAYGYSTKRLLQDTIADVIANDISESQVQEFAQSLTDDEKRRVTLKPGNVLQLDIQENSLDGIQGLRFMHFLRPFEVRALFEKYSKWLKPGGVLCLTAGTPFIAIATSALPIYFERKERGVEWPGELTKDIVRWPEGITCDYGYLFDKEVMTREAERVGFRVLRCEFVTRTFAFTNGKENIGLLAEKI